MKNQEYKDQDQNKFNTEAITSFYNDNRNIINGLGIAALAGAAIYSAVKFLPIQEWTSKVEEKYQERFGQEEDEFASPVANQY